MNADRGGRPGPILTIGVPLVVLGAAGYFGWTMLLKPALEDKKAATSAVTAEGQSTAKKKIRVAGDPWSGYSTFRGEPRLAAELAKHGIVLEYVDDEKLYDQNERMKALAEGRIDVALTTVDAFLQHGARHKKGSQYPGVIIWNIDESSGGDAIFLDKGKRSFDDVGPKDKVCYSAGTPSEHLWDFASLSFASLENVPAQTGVVAKDCWDMLEAGKVQVAVLWQPFTAIAESKGYSKVFATGGQADDVIIDIVVGAREYVKKERDTVQQLAESYFRVIDGYGKDAQGHAAFITKDCGADCAGDAALGAAVLTGIDFLTFEENMCLWYGHCGKPAKMLDRIAKTGRLVAAKGKVRPAELPEPRSVIDDSFLVAMKERLDEKARLAAEVAGQDTRVEQAVLKVEEKKYEYAAEKTRATDTSDVGTLKLPNIYFAEGKSELDANAKSVVDGIADRLVSFPALCVRVYGHTNSKGNPENNRRLSQARAEAIVGYLKAKDGVAFPSSRFDVRGFGSERPVLTNGGEDMDQSRRTEFRLFNCGAS
jgi:outer membrane protein OmpA-like peptidoglycan-associated protein/ABC-type nitrate/sulfonate/bicarbonate transport system substrate-binding protein